MDHMLILLSLADKREFIKISQAVGIGFVIMGVIGFVVKLSTVTSSVSRLHTWACSFENDLAARAFPATADSTRDIVHIPVNNILVYVSLVPVGSRGRSVVSLLVPTKTDLFFLQRRRIAV